MTLIDILFSTTIRLFHRAIGLYRAAISCVVRFLSTVIIGVTWMGFSSPVGAQVNSNTPPPTGLTALAASDPASAILLSWTAPQEETPVHYEVGYSVDSGTAWTDLTEEIQDTSYTATEGLSGKALSVLRYRVRAVYLTAGNNNQNSGWHEMSSAPVVSNLVTTPEAPSGLQAVAGDSWVQLDWSTPSSSGSGGITKYQYRQSSDGGSSWSPDWTDISGSSDSTDTHTVTGLTSGTGYTFQVRAMSVFGAGTSSVEVTAKPLGSDYAAELLSAKLAGNTTHAWYVLTWKPPTATLDAQTRAINNYSNDNGATWNQLSEITDITVNGESLKTGRGPDFARATLVTGNEVVVLIKAVHEGPNSNALTIRAVVPPSFTDGAAATREVAENTAAEEFIGDPIDASGDGTITYSLGGTDGNSFNFNGDTGQLSTKDSLDYEGHNPYSVTVTATDGFHASSSIDVTINVTDEDEAPDAPTGLSVSQATFSTLTLTWTAPDTSDRPPLTGYKVQYQKPRNPGTWLNAPHSGTEATAILSNLNPGRAYNMQVRAVNDEGESPWVSVTGVTQSNTFPVIDTPSFLEVKENITSVVTLSATDPDSGDSQSWSLSGGADQSHFSISGDVLSFKAPKDFENPDDTDGDHRYEVMIHVTDRWSASAAKDVVVMIMDEDEPPAAPSGLNVLESDTSSITLLWVGPDTSDRPRVTGYDVQYRTPRNTGAWLDAPHSGAAVTTKISGLTENAEYDLRVRARNDEGTGDWATTSATAVVNRAPTIQMESFIDVPEHTTSIVTLSARDPDSGATQNWNLIGGADQSHFSISGDALSFTVEKDFENLDDADGQGDYEVRVQVDDGLGGRDSLDLVVSITDQNEPPETPGGLRVSQATPSALTLTWTAPDTSDRPPVTAYKVRYRTPRGKGAWLNAKHFGVETTVTLLGLVASTEYEVWVQAVNADGGSHWAIGVGQTLSVDAPAIATLGPFDVNEDQTRVAHLQATSPKKKALTWSIKGGDDEDHFFLTKSGKLSFRGLKNFEAPDDDDGDGTYDLTVGVGDETDEVVADIQVRLHDVNEAPVISSPDLLGVDENETEVALLEANDDDAGASLTWSIIGGEDRSHFALTTDTTNNSGELSFVNAKDFENPDDANSDGIYLLRVEVNDGSHQVQQELWVQLRDDLETISIAGAPVINTLGPFNVGEGQTAVAILEATDAESDPLNWSIVEGKDGGHFALTTDTTNNTGELSFVDAKDFENPDDANFDGIYFLTVEVHDGSHGTRTNLLVRLQNLDEVPEVDNSNPINMGEGGQDGTISLQATNDKGGGSLSWSLVGGDDEQYFSLTSDGELTFNPGSNSAAPRDNDGDGTYDLTVQVSDGKNTTVVNIQVQLSQKVGPGEGADVSSEVDSPGSQSCGSITQASSPWSPGPGSSEGGGGSPLGGVLLFLGILLCPVLFVQWLRLASESD